jgi:beta-lactamase class A
MNLTLTRRSFAFAAAAGALYGVRQARAQSSGATKASESGSELAQAQAAIAALETHNGGRLGVVAVDTGSGSRISYRADERFAMCSTHKFLTAAAILAMTDRGEMRLDRRVPYSRSDLLSYAPITRKHVGAGFMTVAALCAAAIEWSDNTADNLLLKLIGGPPGWTRFVRSIGDKTSRLDRFEPELSSAINGDPRDTTTPDAMISDMNVVLLGNVLRRESRKRLEGWMLDSKIDATLLHAGLPQGWRVGDKSGSGDNATRNDIGIILRPKRAAILAAVYYTHSTEPLASREKLIADTGRIIAQTFG